MPSLTPVQVGWLGPAPAHVYEFDGNLADTYDGSMMVSGGGSITAGTYAFTEFQGPNVSGLLNQHRVVFAGDDFQLIR